MEKAQVGCETWCCRGAVVHTPPFGEPEILEDTLLVIGPTHQGGKILEMYPGREQPAACSRFGVDPKDVIRLEVRLCQGFLPPCIKMTFLRARPRVSFQFAAGRPNAMSRLHRLACPCAAGDHHVLSCHSWQPRVH